MTPAGWEVLAKMIRANWTFCDDEYLKVVGGFLQTLETEAAFAVVNQALKECEDRPTVSTFRKINERLEIQRSKEQRPASSYQGNEDPALRDRTLVLCPRCNEVGWFRDVFFHAMGAHGMTVKELGRWCEETNIKSCGRTHYDVLTGQWVNPGPAYQPTPQEIEAGERFKQKFGTGNAAAAILDNMKQTKEENKEEIPF